MKTLLRKLLMWMSTPEPKSAVEMWSDMARFDYNELRYRIAAACTIETLDKIEVCIDRFENHYANLIPLRILHPMVVDLVDRMMRERGRVSHWLPQTQSLN
jgi:hypothetical protein